MSGVPEGSARRHARIWPSRMTQDCAQTSWLSSWLSSPTILQWLHPRKQRAAAAWPQVREPWIARRRSPGRGSAGDRMIEIVTTTVEPTIAWLRPFPSATGTRESSHE